MVDGRGIDRHILEDARLFGNVEGRSLRIQTVLGARTGTSGDAEIVSAPDKDLQPTTASAMMRRRG